MAVLLIILAATMALGVRVVLQGGRWNVADSDGTQKGLREAGFQDDSWLVDTCARTLLLVLLSLIGLLLLGMTYGNVLGAVHTGH